MYQNHGRVEVQTLTLEIVSSGSRILNLLFLSLSEVAPSRRPMGPVIAAPPPLPPSDIFQVCFD
jgi:hypothetical protein